MLWQQACEHVFFSTPQILFFPFQKKGLGYLFYTVSPKDFRIILNMELELLVKTYNCEKRKNHCRDISFVLKYFNDYSSLVSVSTNISFL